MHVWNTTRHKTVRTGVEAGVVIASSPSFAEGPFVVLSIAGPAGGTISVEDFKNGIARYRFELCLKTMLDFWGDLGSVQSL